MTRVAIYLRISQDRTGEGLALERQEAACRELCRSRGWTVVAVYRETVSASREARRPEFERLRADVEAGAVDGVVCWDLDRLTRKPAELEWFAERGERLGLMLASVADDYDLGTDAGRLFARIKAAVARAEIERKSARHAEAFRQSVAAGKPAGGRRAFGYRADGVTVAAAEAEFARGVFERWTSGATLGEITRWLNASGQRTTAGNVWTTGSVRTLLENPRYAGLRGVRWIEHDSKGRPVLDGKGRPKRQRYHTVEGTATWPGIVPEPVWRAALSRLQEPSRGQTYRGRDRVHLLAGLALCAWPGCGKRLKSSSNNGKRVLRCPSLRHANRLAEPIEQLTKAVVVERLRRDDARELFRQREPGVDVPALLDEATGIRERLANLARLEVLGQRSAVEVAAAREAATERLAEIERLTERAGQSAPMGALASALAEYGDPGAAWESLTLAQRQVVIGALLAIHVGPGKGGPSRTDEPPVNVWLTWSGTENADLEQWRRSVS